MIGLLGVAAFVVGMFFAAREREARNKREHGVPTDKRT
jgi:hypothetical protein